MFKCVTKKSRMGKRHKLSREKRKIQAGSQRKYKDPVLSANIRTKTI